MNAFSLVIGAALLGAAAGCHRADVPAEAPFAATFEVLDAQGRPATAFPRGQNPVFRFRLVNRTDQPIYFASPLFDVAPFLVVTTDAGVPVGRPYSGIFCLYSWGHTLAAHEALDLTIPWLAAEAYPTRYPFCGHAATTALPVGRYRTAFAPAFTWRQRSSPSSNEPYQTTPAQPFAREWEVTGP